MTTTHVHTPPPETLDAIVRKAVHIQQAARYLQTHARDVEESQSAHGIYRLAREIETLIEAIEEGKAA